MIDYSILKGAKVKRVEEKEGGGWNASVTFFFFFSISFQKILWDCYLFLSLI
jgi:hypothetical protein